jgi:L-malate glycosyltransferase
MNIAICSSGDLFGGVERFILTLACELRRVRRCRTCVVLFAKGTLYDMLRRYHIDTEVFDVPRYDFTVIGRLARLFADRHIAVAHTHGYKANLLCGVAARLSRTRIVKTEHGGLEPLMPFERARLTANVGVDRWLSPYLIDRIVYVSKDIQRRNGRYYQRIPGAVIYNGIAPAQLESAAAPPHHRPECFHIGIVGRLTAVKGHIYLLQALASLPQPDLQLHVIGEGELRGELENASRQLGLADRVHFHGFRADADAFVRSLDAVVMPSLHEGFPYTMLEAGYWGVPLIASRVGGIQEVLSDGHECLLVEPRNVEHLAAAIAKLQRDPALRAQIGENARRKVRQDFLIESTVNKYLAVYEESLNGRIQ